VVECDRGVDVLKAVFLVHCQVECWMCVLRIVWYEVKKSRRLEERGVVDNNNTEKHTGEKGSSFRQKLRYDTQGRTRSFCRKGGAMMHATVMRNPSYHAHFCSSASSLAVVLHT